MSKRLRMMLFGAALGSLLASAGSPAGAAPIFARKYGFKCSMCHAGFPRLNDFGQRFRNNGYRLPGRETDEKLVYELQAPLALRTSAGYNFEHFTKTPGSANVSSFQLNGLDVLSAGLLSKQIGYWMVYTPPLSASNAVAGQDGSLESANVVFSFPKTNWARVRAGRFEPAYVPFSVKRSLSVAPYEIYNLAFTGGPAFSETRTGLEVTGFGRTGSSYAAGWLTGSGTNRSSDSPSDLYLRVAKAFGGGEGQTAGHRLGLTGYYGQARPDASLPVRGQQAYTRLGLDGTGNLGPWSLGAQVLFGHDPRALWGTGKGVSFNGGFVEALYLPATRWVGFGRFDWVDGPASIASDVTRWTLGARHYLQDSLALHVEGSARSASGGARDNSATCRVDWAF